MQIDETITKDVVTLTLRGRIDSTNADVFEKAVLRVSHANATHLLLDFSSVDYMSSAGLRVVLIAAKRMLAMKRELAICGLNATLDEVFTTSGLGSLLQILPSAAAFSPS
ncbi:MAG: STAS domain-containing protein [Alphaproteobacteria bacterium]|nr:STAS domain-containing protein [Alphaproteobacteria bacterium]